MEPKTSASHPDDIDDNMVSSSPDSGLCDLDLKFEDPSKKDLLLDPLLYNRRLTLLKSLSQDSEYSLDTSLFDAEEFLQDMGFAGGRDPTIPDRFLPSLMQRLSRCPESEMESLHDRIIQSIGCFRRKEGKRRLFRNFSMGKDPRRRNFLGSPSSSHPLLRSNTDPSTFPYEETSSTTSSSSLVGRLSSNDSRLHSLGSSKDESEFPESPIAILVSAASLDQDQRDLLTDGDDCPGSLDDKTVLLADAASQADLDDVGEFADTVKGIQNLTDKISGQDYGGASLPDNDMYLPENEDVSQLDVSQHDEEVSQHDDEVSQHDDEVSQLDDPCSQLDGQCSQLDAQCGSNELLTENDEGIVFNKNDHANEKELGEFSKEFHFESSQTDVIHEFSSLKNSNVSRSDKDLVHVPSLDSYEKSSNSKTPLRRTSNAVFYNPKSLETSDDLQYQNNKDDDSSENALKRLQKQDTDLQYSILKDNNINKFIKPKYSRDDSLTNFLSSMLDTSDILGSRPLIPSTNLFSENKCNSDSELPGSFSSSPFISLGTVDGKSKSQIIESPKKILTAFAPVKGSKSKDSFDKAPNRKRRVLRRMSSSLQCCDDVNCNDSSELKVYSLNGDVCTSKTSSSPETNTTPKINQESFKSASSTHRSIHPCSSLPVINICRSRNLLCETDGSNTYVVGCQKNVSGNCYDCDVRLGRNLSHFRKCKRRRNLSCPAPEIHMNRNLCFKPQAQVKPLQIVQCSCMIDKPTQYFTENNPHTSVVLPCTLSQKEAWTPCSCCSEHSNHKINLCCSTCPFNTFHSLSNEDCDSNIRCLGPPGPSFHQSSSNSFNFAPNLWDQNRYLCHSSPDLRHACCTNKFEEHSIQGSFANLDERSHDKFCPETSFRGDNNFSDDVFFKDANGCCSKSYNQCLGAKQNAKKSKLSNRTPQRQNSISIEDSEIPIQNWASDSNNFIVLSSSNKNVVEKESFPPLSTSNISFTKDNKKDVTYSLNAPKTTQLSEAPPNSSAPDNKLSLIRLSELDTQGTKEIPEKQPSSPATKSEALLERKIRIFSKFLANLGNLSKSIPDTVIDNKHKRITRDQKSSDVPASDKKSKSRLFKVSCPAVQSRKCSATPHEFDKLFSLLNSMDLSDKNSEKENVPSEKNGALEISERNLQKIDSPIYENKVILQASDGKDQSQHRSYKPVLYSSSVSLYINPEDKKDIKIDRNEKPGRSPPEYRDVGDDLAKVKISRYHSSPHMSFKGVSKEIEDLQLSIQRAKETRMCASKELHLLQELLSMDAMVENTAKDLTGVYANRCEQEALSKSANVKTNEALADLREKSKKEVLEDTFWQEEIQRVKEETKQAWQDKLDRMEARLLSQEEELKRLQSDNEALHRLDSPSCQHCRTENVQNGRTDSAFEDDEEYLNHKPSLPIQSTRKECDRLQQRLMEEEQRADQLNLMLNQKLIELNKIQITLSKQTKEMIELEKSYLQLQCRLRRGTSKPVVSRLCSRSSPFSPKNLCPKPSPPASPQPSNGAM